ncbi:lymphocyte antigen 6L [Nematostella vectensis]|uniref:lymphocyte antigen 6L n=1 Tax=Nematostella vectensis TaxID=45351 RepID=UPI0020779026|nr:lymphocyte antigen 6L [Nematostella vectensis]
MKPSFALTFCVLAVLIPAGCGLQCYRCYSTRSWYDCEKYMKVVDCPPSANTCVKMKQITDFGGSKIVQHDRKCYVKSACGDFCERMKNKTSQWDCTLSCCDTDACNKSLTLLPGIAMMVTVICAVLLI